MSKSGSVPEFRDSVEAAVYCLGGYKIVKDVIKKAMRSRKERYEKDPCAFPLKGRFRRFDVIEFDFGIGKETLVKSRTRTKRIKRNEEMGRTRKTHKRKESRIYGP